MGRVERHKLYEVWRNIKRRCYNPSHYAYEQYGGRGIKMCDEWSDFERFYSWSLANGYEDGLSLDRIDNNGWYSPKNCRWSTWKEQGNNRRTNVLITFDGKTQSMAKWADEIGISRAALWGRLHRKKMPLDMALTAQKGTINRWNRKENIENV